MNKNELHYLIAEKHPNICQIAAMKDSNIIYSDTWNDYQKDDNVHIASVTKSIMAILIGIAIDKGLIAGVKQKVLDFFPNYVIKRGEKTIQAVTIYDLITMTAPYKYKSEPWTKVCTSEDWTKSALDLLGGKSGITGEFKYSTLGIQILSGILSETSKMSTLEFANQYLFVPLGIEPRKNLLITNKEEHIKFITSKLPKENSWFCDPRRISAAGFGLCLSADDLCKIGQMCLNNGVWRNNRIVSAEWLRQMFKPRIKCDEKFNFMQYGYLWWILDEQKRIYAAIGDGGNIIYVNTDNGVVISISATFKPAVFDRVEFIKQYIEPFVAK